MARKQGHNKAVYEEKIRDAINVALRLTLKDPRLVIVSVTRVELNNDYSAAKVFWDTYDANKRGDTKKAVDGIASKLRAVLAKELQVRHTPHLEFFFDSRFEDEKKIEDLLKSSDES